jgi:hypothetical protein
VQGWYNLITIVQFHPVLPAGKILDHSSVTGMTNVPLINLYPVTNSELLLGHFVYSSSH